MALLLFAFAGCASRPRLRAYATDGCSLFPDGTEKNRTLWLHCCQAHDYRYWMGGTKEERLKADLELRDCVAHDGRPKTGAWMLSGARAGGTPYLPTSFRWGYGWAFPRGYKPITKDERKLIKKESIR